MTDYRAAAGVVFVAALLLYSVTLAPTVGLIDSGELIVVAHGLGVAHPPGVPLWTMLAHLASLVPFGSVAQRINFSSALCAALACATLTLAVAELVTTAPASRLPRLPIAIPALAAGLLMACSRTLWSYATISEVYALNTFLITVILFLIVRWRRRHLEGATSPDAWLYASAFVFGLALGVHHATVALTLPAAAVIVYRTEGARFFTSTRLARAAAIAFGAMVTVYAYLPWAASRAPLINWGHPRSLQEVWWHITGREYQVNFSLAPGIIGHQFGEFCITALREWGFVWCPLALALAAIGVAGAWRRDRTTFWWIATVVIANLAYALSYEIAEDKDAYYLPTFLALAVASGLGLRDVLEHAASRRASLARPAPIGAAALVLLSTTALAANWPYNDRRHDWIAHDYVENLFQSIDRDGLLLTRDWQVASPMFYAQAVDQRRRDVKVVDVNLLRRTWYFEYLAQAYPDLLQRSRAPIEAYLQDLRAWEADPGAFARDPARSQRINTAFVGMIQAVVTNEHAIAPVYMTGDVFASDSVDGELTRWIAARYPLVPQGLVFDLTAGGGVRLPRDVHLETRGLADGTRRFDTGDVVITKVRPVYTTMLVYRGRYFAQLNRPDRAAMAFAEALALDPDLPSAAQGLADNTAKLRGR